MRLLSISCAIAFLLAFNPAHAQENPVDGQILIKTQGGLSLQTADGQYSLKLGGRVQYDYNRSEYNGTTDEDAFDVRRARLYLDGDLVDWSYKIQFNIGESNGGTPEDLYIRYEGFENLSITIGKQKEAFGLEQLGSSKDNGFLERTAASEAYTPGRSEGIQLAGQSGRVNYAIGIFEDEFSGTASSDFAMSGRITSAVVNNSDLLLHLGVAYTSRAGDVSSTGLEAALVRGSIHLQTEYFASDNAGTELDGYYLQAGWILSGESRPYSSKKGVFGRVPPDRNTGAWEVVLRYEGGEGKYDDIELGTSDARALGIGLNWYANSYARFGLSYTSGEDQNSSDTGNELRARFQLVF